MVFNSYEELKAAVAQRRQEVLTLEVDLGGGYSQEYEDAKAELTQAQAMKAITGGGFLADNVEALKQRVADLKPKGQSIYIQYSKLDLDEWQKLISVAGLDAFGQYERVLPKVFLGLYGQDPVKPEDWPEDEHWEQPEPLTTSPLSVSVKGGAESILPGGSLASVVQSFMAWQNSGGDVSIRPTKSGRD
jgi:hypothetical protein